MASPARELTAEEQENLKQYFFKCNKGALAAGSKEIPEEKLRYATGKGISKMIEPLMGASIARFCEGSITTKMADMKTKKVSVEVFCGPFMHELSTYAVKNVESLKKKKISAEDYQAELLAKVVEELNKKKETTKDAAVVNRLTNTSGYTGSHKERFNADGSGKGTDGRKDKVVNTGYVGNYKNAGSFGGKK